MDDSVVLFFRPRGAGPGTVGTEIAALDAGFHAGCLGHSRDNFSEIWLRIPHNLAHLTLSPAGRRRGQGEGAEKPVRGAAHTLPLRGAPPSPPEGGRGALFRYPKPNSTLAIRAFIKLTKYC